MAKLVSKTYGQALFELALEQKLLEQIAEEIIFVRQIFNENRELVQLLNHPQITKEEKINVVENIFKGRISDTVTGFLVIVLQKERNKELNSIFEYFEDKVYEYKNIGIVFVTSASELNEEQKQKLTERLLQVTSFKQLNVEYLVKPEIIGGLIIRIGDRVIDSSICSKISRITKELSKVSLS